MLGVTQLLKAKTYRRTAAICDAYAICARSNGDRDQLTRMRDVWLALAANENWLDGLPPASPAKALALPVAA